MKKKDFFGAILFCGIAGAMFLSGCGSQTPSTEVAVDITRPSVEVSSVSALRSVTRTLAYSGMISANQETTYTAKATGAIRGFSVKVGDTVSVAQEIGIINDADSNATLSMALNADQVRQAQLTVSQALQSYQIAQQNYQTLVQTSAKDISQAEIARNQAETGQMNTGASISEQRTAANIALETAKTAQEQAYLALSNRKAQIVQSEVDAKSNALLTANNAVDSCSTFVFQMDAIAALSSSSGGGLAYGKYLGMTDSQSYDRARSAWDSAKKAVDEYKESTETDSQKRLVLARSVVDATKTMVDAVKNVFDHTPASSMLPQSAVSGISISGFQTQAGTAQAQMNGLLTQIQTTGQGLESLFLANSTSLDALQKSAEVSDKQLASADQNIKTLEAGTKTQQNQAGFASESARNQESSTRARVEGQLAVSRGQVELAKFQYDNAVVALESLIDSRKIVVSMNGVVTKIFVENGDSVSAGMPILTVSTVDSIKVTTFVDQANVSDIRPGTGVENVSIDGVSSSGTILTVSPVADSATKRFAVDIQPSASFPLGTIVDVRIPVTRESDMSSIIVPLDSVNVRSDANSIFVIRDESVIRLSVDIQSIFGESAFVRVQDLREDDDVVVRGGKRVADGEKVSVVEAKQ